MGHNISRSNHCNTKNSVDSVERATKRGYFGIGLFFYRNNVNIGTLFRSAVAMNADFLFTIGRKFVKQNSDTLKSWKNKPIYNYPDFDTFYNYGLPYSTELIGLELCEKSEPISGFVHPERAVYLLGDESNGLLKVK